MTPTLLRLLVAYRRSHVACRPSFLSVRETRQDDRRCALCIEADGTIVQIADAVYDAARAAADAVGDTDRALAFAALGLLPSVKETP